MSRRACLTRISDRNPIFRVFEGGQLCELETERQTTERRGGGLRKHIRDFSADSRRRLQRRLAMINEMETKLPDFLTLTYPAEYSGDWREWKRHLHNFIKALVRRWPELWGVWRLEFQKRGAPHFHFLLFDGPNLVALEVLDGNRNNKRRTIADPLSDHNKEIFKWISETWYRIVGSGDPRHLAAGTRIEPIQSWNGVRHYTAKYLAKLPEEGGFVPAEYDGTGRFWGVIGKARWKVSMFEKEIPELMFFKIKRVLRKMLEKKGLNPWRMRLRGAIDHGMSTFISSPTALRLLVWAWEETGGCPF